MARFATLLSLALAVALAAPSEAQTKLTASTAANADFLGAHVAVSDDGLWAVAAAPLSDAGGATDTGALYVFSRTEGGAWSEAATLTASDAAEFDNLGTWTNGDAPGPLNGGSTLAISGDGTRIAAGATLADIGGNVDQGAVYVFTRGEDGAWSQEAKLTGAATLFTQFGFSVALSDAGERLVVGARYDDLGTEDTNEGRAYVFDRSDDGTWTEIGRLTAETSAAADFFGAAVDISSDGQMIAVGAPLDDSATITDPASNDAGAVYVFAEGDDGSWAMQARLETTTPIAFDNLGYAVALSGDGSRIAAGAFPHDVDGNVDAGAVYVFSNNGEGTWTQEAELTGSGAVTATFANLGVQVSINDDGRRVLAGAPLDDFAGDQNEGRAYVFTRADDGTWTETSVLAETGGSVADFFGSSVALSGDGETAIVGAIFDDNPAVTDPANNDQGAAFVFELEALPAQVATVDGPDGAYFVGDVYPNPLRGTGTLEVTVPTTQPVSVVLYNVLGQRVSDVFSGVVTGGQARALAVPTAGLPAGVYVLQLRMGEVITAQRFVVAR